MKPELPALQPLGRPSPSAADLITIVMTTRQAAAVIPAAVVAAALRAPRAMRKMLMTGTRSAAPLVDVLVPEAKAEAVAEHMLTREAGVQREEEDRASIVNIKKFAGDSEVKGKGEEMCVHSGGEGRHQAVLSDRGGG